MARLARVRQIVVRTTARWGRDGLAIAGAGCLAVGLGTINIALAWLTIGVFLLAAATTGSRRIA